MLRPHRLYGEDEGDYNGIALPTSKRRKICTVPNDANETEAGDVVERSEKPQKICFGMVSYYH